MTNRTMRTIRIASEQDIQKCAALLGVLFSQEHEFTPDTAAQERGLGMIVRNPSVGRIFVCEQDGEVIGMVNLLFTVSTALGRKVALLEDMVVLPRYRGQGHGSALIDHACRWAADEGFARITLLTDGDNETAHRFYASKGFSRSDMTIFRKTLKPHESSPSISDKETIGLPAWICIECGYVYDPSEGDLEWNIRPGIPFEKLPHEWYCPVCNADRTQFRLFDSTL